ncbi:hypothetical protein TKK_0001807 [Trichogramma kaykai]
MAWGAGKKPTRKVERYQVCVTIIKAKHLEANSNSQCVVRLGDRKKKTLVRKRTDSPYFNEYFVFDLTCSLEELLGTRLDISIFLRGRLKRSKFHGSADFEIAAVWDQADHQYHHKWAMLTNPRDLAAGPKGYVMCNVAVLAKGEKTRLPPDTDGDDDIEGNLLLPLGTNKYLSTRQCARYIFTLYRAEDLPREASEECYLNISFAGMKASTSSEGGCGDPCYNERIVFREMFPSLCHRARLVYKCRKTGQLATHLLNFKDISNSSERGFLPTFGPSFIHLYGDEEPIYRGRLLLSLKVEIDILETATAASVTVEDAPGLAEASIWRVEEYLLVCVLHDACMIDRSLLACGKSVSFELNLGNAGNRKYCASAKQLGNQDDDDEQDDEETFKAGSSSCIGCASADSKSASSPLKIDSLDNKYNYIALGAEKPCCHVKSWWPNTDWRQRNSNRLNFIADFLESELEQIDELEAANHESCYVSYNATMRTLKLHCSDYLRSLRSMSDTICGSDNDDDDDGSCLTILDKYRLNHCRLEMEKMLDRLKAQGELKDNALLRIGLLHARRHLQLIKELATDPQHSQPDIFIWLLRKNRRVAYARLPAARFIHAEERAERGRDCGLRTSVFLKRPEAAAVTLDATSDMSGGVCKLELFLWLGNAKFAAACWSALPPGYRVDETRATAAGLDKFPARFEYEISSKFQLRVHLYQGRFEPGMDSSGLLDPMVRIIFQGYTMTTKVKKQTLDPFWDQTLVLPAIDLHATPEYVKDQPPKVVMEVFDSDYNRLELYGRCLVEPMVKFKEQQYSTSDFLPRLKWHKLTGHQQNAQGAVMAAFELVQLDKDDEEPKSEAIDVIPEIIRPRLVSYRLEVIFWGIRDFKRLNLISVTKPKLVVRCGEARLESSVMENAARLPNFPDIHAMLDLNMPEEEIYYPPIMIKAFESRVGRFAYVGVCNVPTIYSFVQKLVTRDEYETAIYQPTKKSSTAATRQHVNVSIRIDEDDEGEGTTWMSYKKLKNYQQNKKSWLGKLLPWNGPSDEVAVTLAVERDDSLDWWSKYYASIEEEKNKESGPTSKAKPWIKRLASFKVYSEELESQPEFSGFQDRLRTFELHRGKHSNDPRRADDDDRVGKFKGFIAIYRWPHPDGLSCVNRVGRSANSGLLNDYPSQEPLSLVVRVYVVKCLNLNPTDPLSGKTDAYLRLKLGKRVIDDRKRYIPNQLNPTFGRVYELEALLPKDHSLLLQLWDYDATSADDLIGETRVDIENRFYSQHRATCGLALTYDETGYNAWRDREKPCQILRQLCKRNNLPLPEYWDDHVRIGKIKFLCPGLGDQTDKEERMALSVLHRWSDFPICGCALVPEHVERRPLFNPKRPGLQQGRVEMWIDMFPIDELPAKPATDISPQPREDYELRVIIWNTENVPLVDSQFLTGEKCSDIYVKGWILPEDAQRTDVHYNSLTGEGNFNWRFTFRFTWARGERCMIIRRKASVFARDETEQQVPCVLEIQVWDSDHFSKDDFLGALSLDLGKLPKGSHSSRNCKLNLLDPNTPRVNLFRLERTRAWWPLSVSKTVGHPTQAGKIELELSLLPVKEADQQPVGRGRKPPEALPPPKRPDTSFSWFRNPWKACCFVVCRYYRWRIIGCCCCIFVVLLVAAGVYAFPGYFVKRLVGA